MSLVARHLEVAGIVTVVIGSARDIVEECGVPRFVFVDFPLGNPCGKPWDVSMQQVVIGEAFDLMEKAWQPRTTVQAPFVWNESENDLWRDRYMRVDDSNREILAEAGRQRREKQKQAKRQKA
ncbi:MAG: hypothetical protein MAG581_01230 [Deltaproteobacteria bacterium]|nr:hypothetical protein [Deltaproteobacteria bacterium]